MAAIVSTRIRKQRECIEFKVHADHSRGDIATANARKRAQKRYDKCTTSRKQDLGALIIAVKNAELVFARHHADVTGWDLVRQTAPVPASHSQFDRQSTPLRDLSSLRRALGRLRELQTQRPKERVLAIRETDRLIEKAPIARDNLWRARSQFRPVGPPLTPE